MSLYCLVCRNLVRSGAGSTLSHICQQRRICYSHPRRQTPMGHGCQPSDSESRRHPLGNVFSSLRALGRPSGVPEGFCPLAGVGACRDRASAAFTRDSITSRFVLHQTGASSFKDKKKTICELMILSVEYPGLGWGVDHPYLGRGRGRGQDGI